MQPTNGLLVVGPTLAIRPPIGSATPSLSLAPAAGEDPISAPTPADLRLFPPTPMRIRNRPLHRCLPTNASPPRKPPAGRPDLALEGAAMAAGGGKEENLGAYLTQIGLVRRRRGRAAGGSSPQPAGGSMGPGVVDHGAAPGQVEDWGDRVIRLSVEEENGISRTRKMEEPLVMKRKQSQEDDEELLAIMWSKTKMKQRKIDAGKGQPQEKNIEDIIIEKRHKRRMCKASSKSSNQSKVGHVMVGSRCSRINGRGWRCSQQTLVGYSLCEHHLGKGKLKSMSSLPGRHSARKNMNSMLSSDDIDEQDQTLMEAKKSMQDRKSCTVGLVKARTVSSLLNVVASHDHNSAMLSIDASAGGDGSIGTVPVDDQFKKKVVVT